MRNRQPDPDQAGSTDPLQERTQRDQVERSKQALSNQGSQDRKPSDAATDQARRDDEQQ